MLSLAAAGSHTFRCFVSEKPREIPDLVVCVTVKEGYAGAEWIVTLNPLRDGVVLEGSLKLNAKCLLFGAHAVEVVVFPSLVLPVLPNRFVMIKPHAHIFRNLAKASPSSFVRTHQPYPRRLRWPNDVTALRTPGVLRIRPSAFHYPPTWCKHGREHEPYTMSAKIGECQEERRVLPKRKVYPPFPFLYLHLIYLIHHFRYPTCLVPKCKGACVVNTASHLQESVPFARAVTILPSSESSVLHSWHEPLCNSKALREDLPRSSLTFSW